LKNVAIIGATGYGAIELIRLIQSHKQLEISKIISHSQAGEQIASIYPHLTGFIEQPMEALDIEELKKEADIVFLAAPAGVAKDIVPKFADASLQVVDLSGDLRLPSLEQYETWYGGTAATQETLDQAVYGLTEIYREEIKQATLISNPGCFPTSALLGLIPALDKKIMATGPIMIDGKTGISGAGGKPSSKTHFSSSNENVIPYSVGNHKHIPEIENYLSDITGESVKTTFVPHLIPMTRGLICTMYGTLTKKISTEEIIQLYKTYYQDHPFVRVKEEGKTPKTKDVYGSNFCDIGIYADSRTNQLIITAAIDNLVKGASGQAIQNVNVMNGWEETEGLSSLPIYP